MRGASCHLHSFLVYFVQLLCRCGSLPIIFSSFGEIQLVLFEISNSVVDRICQQESAECVGKQGAHSEWVKRTILQALSRTEGQNWQAGSRARRGCYSQAARLSDYWAMDVVNLN